MLNHKSAFMHLHGQASLSQFLAPTGAPVNVHAQPVQMPAITNALSNFFESDEVHWFSDEHTNTFMGDVHAQDWMTNDTHTYNKHANALQGMHTHGCSCGSAL